MRYHDCVLGSRWDLKPDIPHAQTLVPKIQHDNIHKMGSLDVNSQQRKKARYNVQLAKRFAKNFTYCGTKLFIILMCCSM